MMQKAIVAGGVAWATPVVTTFAEPVAAAAPSTLLNCPTLYQFDTGTAEGWTIDNSAGVGNGLWNVASGRSVSPNFALHYGTGVGGNYNTGGRNAGTVTSPAFVLPNSGPMDLQFSVWRAVETYPSGNWDRFSVSIVPSGGSATVLYQVARDGGTGGVFQNLSFDLSPWAGQTAAIAMNFDTGDASFNNFEGIWVDDITIPCGSLVGGGGGGLSRLGPSWVPDEEPPNRREVRRRRRESGRLTGSTGGLSGSA